MQEQTHERPPMIVVKPPGPRSRGLPAKQSNIDTKGLLTVTGGDSVEAALSVARRATGKKTAVAFEGAYHGVHQGVVSMTASSHYLDYAGVSRQNVFRLPYPYSYRFPFPVERKGDE